MKWQIRFNAKEGEQAVTYQRNVNGLQELVSAFDEIFHDRKEEEVLEVHITRR